MDSVVVFVARFLVMKNVAGSGLARLSVFGLNSESIPDFSLGKVNNPLFFSLFLFCGAFP